MVACNIIIAIHLIYLCPITMLKVVVVKFIYQNSVIHAGDPIKNAEAVKTGEAENIKEMSFV